MARDTVRIDTGEELGNLIREYSEGPLAATLSDAIRRGLDIGNIRAVSRIKVRRMTGTGPFPVGQHRLGHRSRRLIRAFTASRARVVDARKIIVATSMGSNVSYFGAHEFGFSGKIRVKAHERDGRPVRAHLRHVRVPERAMVRTELNNPSTQDFYTDAIGGEIARALL
jgi:hypothetical protein